ncbi:TPA: transposase, partial [Streptococcus suis]
NAMELPYSNAKLEATNNLIKVIKRNAFGFRNFENFKKRVLIALNSEKGWGEPFSAYLLKTRKRGRSSSSLGVSFSSTHYS